MKLSTFFFKNLKIISNISVHEKDPPNEVLETFVKYLKFFSKKITSFF